MDAADPRAANQARLRQYVEDENAMLQRTLRMYVARAQLGQGEVAIRGIADELLNEMVVEALEHADRFREASAPRAWLLGIAANLIKRRQTEAAKRHRREPLLRDLVPPFEDTLSDDELFDRVAALAVDDPSAALESDQRVAALLSSVPEADRMVLRLAILHELNGEMLARELGIRPGAARVRLHRAIQRLRDALQDGSEL